MAWRIGWLAICMSSTAAIATDGVAAVNDQLVVVPKPPAASPP